MSDDDAELVASFKPRFDDGSRWVLTRTVLLRLLGIVYFVAFVSAMRQGPALVGEHGLLPMQPFLRAVARAAGGARQASSRRPRSSG